MTLQSNEQIVKLGILTDTVLNAAGAQSQVTIELENKFPEKYFATHIIIEKEEDFNAGSAQFRTTLQIGDETPNNGGIPKVMMSIPFGQSFAAQNNGEPLFHAALSGGIPTCNGYGDAPVRLDINFDMGNGEVNPKNYSSGVVSISAIIREF